MMIHQRYPLTMNHPSFKPAVLSEASADSGHHGQAALWPPVIVNNEDQEEYYLAKGYISPRPSAAADFVSQQAAAKPPGYTGPQTYPRWENGRLVQDPDLVVDNHTWPMWVHPPEGDSVIVQNPAEYRKVMGHDYGIPVPKAAPSEPEISPDANELAEFRRWKASQAAPVEELKRAERKVERAKKGEKAELLAMAAEMGVHVNKVWPAQKIKERLEAATT